MESVGAAMAGEWSFFSGMYSTEEADFMAQLLGMNYGTEEGNGFLKQDISIGSLEESGGDLSLLAPELGQNMHNDRELEIPETKPSAEDKFNRLSPNSNKRSRNSGDVQKGKRNIKSKKNQKLSTTCNNDEDDNAAIQRQSSSSYCSEDGSNASHELNGGVTSSSSPKGSSVLNLNGKARACKRSATDSQSLYARKRRGRINERLRILQNLVPNGTKVDISTMLEEAVEYVKFLQLQIKLLSSDDLWMYAPIAYSGMDMGLDLKITSPR